MSFNFLKSVLGSSTEQTQSTDNVSASETPAQTDNVNDPPNKSSNVDLQKNIWEPKTEETQTDNQTSQQQQPQPAQQQDPAQAMQDHLASLNLMQDIDMAKIESEIVQGSTESLQNAFKSVGENVYKAALTQVNQLVDSKLEKVKQESIREANASVDAKSAIREMNQKIPFTEDPNIAPVAQAALNSFLAKDLSLPEAIKATAKYFDNVSAQVNTAKDFSGNQPGESGFNSSQQNNNKSKQSSHDDWISILTQGNN